MGKDYPLIRSGLKFFGRMSASSTHEIKNTIAIINENAGLLGDLAAISETGKPLSSEKVKQISARIMEQVERTDKIVKRLNRFSHSVDNALERADIETVVRFTIALASRLIQMKGVDVDIISAPFPLRIETSLLFLKNLIWRAVESALTLVENKKKVTISFAADDKNTLIWFTFDVINKKEIDKLFRSKEDEALIDYLQVNVKKDMERNRFGLVWTKP